MNKIKCIIFDCDGVLVDSEPIGNQVLLSMAKEHGLEMTLDQMIKEFSGRGLKDCFQQIQKTLNKNLPDDFESEYRRKTFEAFRSELKPINGVVEFIETLTVSYCVASSGPPEKIHLNLTLTGMIQKFENKIFSSYQINSWKPEPDIFLFAAKQMRFSIDECIVIEDSKAGVIAATKGGFKVYGFASKNSSKELLDAGATIFFNFGDLSEIWAKENLEYLQKSKTS